ncbi:MAG: hypothetical protein HY403_11135 [Elusimicrobia bacterium]|nr:hypothetical protein [Elusimicrobiota bacterium]
MRRLIGRRGVSLVELVIATGLASLALAALAALTATGARHQVQALRSATAQMSAALAFKAIEREMSEATYVIAPAAGTSNATTLEACANARLPAAGGALEPINPARPMRFFAFCRTSAGIVRYHARTTGCPAAYTCGAGPVASFGSSARPVDARFTRPLGGDVIQVALTASSDVNTATRGSSFSVAVPSGRNP